MMSDGACAALHCVEPEAGRQPQRFLPILASTKNSLGSCLVIIVEAGADDVERWGPLRSPFSPS